MSIKYPLIESVTPKTKWYVVLRPFDGASGKFVRGEVVDTTEWRHTNTLETRRYIARFPQGGKLPDEELQSDGTMKRIITPSKTTPDTASKKSSRKSD